MNTFTTVIINLACAALSALPVERIVALLLNKLIDKIGPSNIDKASKTAEHLAELSKLFNDIVTDKAVTAEEVSSMRDSIIRARERLLAEWAIGADGKATQVELGKVGLVAEYAETASAK